MGLLELKSVIFAITLEGPAEDEQQATVGRDKQSKSFINAFRFFLEISY